MLERAMATPVKRNAREHPAIVNKVSRQQLCLTMAAIGEPWCIFEYSDPDLVMSLLLVIEDELTDRESWTIDLCDVGARRRGVSKKKLPRHVFTFLRAAFEMKPIHPDQPVKSIAYTPGFLKAEAQSIDA